MVKKIAKNQVTGLTLVNYTTSYREKVANLTTAISPGNTSYWTVGYS